jgi:hypothetical protein
MRVGRGAGRGRGWAKSEGEHGTPEEIEAAVVRAREVAMAKSREVPYAVKVVRCTGGSFPPAVVTYVADPSRGGVADALSMMARLGRKVEPLATFVHGVEVT